MALHSYAVERGARYRDTLYTKTKKAFLCSHNTSVQGVPIPCAPLHSITGQGHTPNLYIFMIPHQFQINMQDSRTPTLFAYFRSRVFWVRSELIFVNKFCLMFWGSVTKTATKYLIIDVDSYIIPHFKANTFYHKSTELLHYLNNYAWCESRLNG